MLACAATATTTALGLDPSTPTYVPLQGIALKQALIILGTAAAGTVAAGVAAAKTKSKNVGVVHNGFAGVVFGLGLCFSGMTRPSLVRLFEGSCSDDIVLAGERCLLVVGASVKHVAPALIMCANEHCAAYTCVRMLSMKIQVRGSFVDFCRWRARWRRCSRRGTSRSCSLWAAQSQLRCHSFSSSS